MLDSCINVFLEPSMVYSCPFFIKAVHLGYKEIPGINIIRNKREHTHNCCLPGNTRGKMVFMQETNTLKSQTFSWA